MCAQIHWVLRLQFTRSTVGTHELFSEFPIPPAFTCYGEAGHPPVTDSPVTVYDRGGGVGRVLGVGSVLGVGLGRGVEVGVDVGVTVGIEVGVAVAVGVAVGVGDAVGVAPAAGA